MCTRACTCANCAPLRGPRRATSRSEPRAECRLEPPARVRGHRPSEERGVDITDKRGVFHRIQNIEGVQRKGQAESLFLQPVARGKFPGPAQIQFRAARAPQTVSRDAGGTGVGDAGSIVVQTRGHVVGEARTGGEYYAEVQIFTGGEGTPEV